MFTFTGLIIILSVLGLIIMGSLAILRDSKKEENRWFAFAAFMIAMWIPSNYIASSVNAFEWSILFLDADLALAPFVGFTLMVFMAVFARKITPNSFNKDLLQNSAVLPLFIFVNIVLALLVFTGVMVSTGVENNYLEIEYKNPFYLYALVLFFYFGYALRRMYVGKKHAYPEFKGAANLIYVGFLTAISANVLTNMVFPVLFSDIRVVKQLNIVGYIGLVVMVLMINIAITKKQLFDIRLIVVRALAYFLLILTLSGIYVAVVFGLANRILGTESVFSQQVIPIITAIFLVFTAPFFKKLFDRITNRFFYQDAYDTQVLLDELNGVLIGNIELSILLRHASEVIQRHIKLDFCAIAVNEDHNSPLRIVGTKDMKLNSSNSAFLRREMGKINKKIILTDDLTSHHAKLKKILNDGNVAIAIKLRSGSMESEDLAYMLLGPKRSGNMYGKGDIKVIDIIADSMVIAIQNALRFEEIQGFAAKLQERVDEATAKLKRTNAKLRALDETKDEFISMASHQLRTPLTSVKGYLSMVLEGDVGKVDPKQKKLLDQAFTSSQRMVYLIADLLNVSRLKTGKFVITPTPTDLCEMVQSEINQLTEAAKAKDIKLTFKKPSKLTLINLDETKTRQVVMNFADNAIYYTPNGGKIDIEIKEDKNNIYFTVKDNGIGIPKEEQSKLFAKFFRATNAKNVRPDGTGLGLFMAKKVISVQGGSIIFESHVGKGSTFGFCFSKSKLRIGQPDS